jgi:hypothetical protein
MSDGIGFVGLGSSSTRAIAAKRAEALPVEPVIGHIKAGHRMARNYLWYRQGDAINAHMFLSSSLASVAAARIMME